MLQTAKPTGGKKLTIPISVLDGKTPRAPKLAKPQVGATEHIIFGKQPHKEADLKRQMVSALSFWYFKAVYTAEDAARSRTAQSKRVVEEAESARGSIYEAILCAKPNNASEVARQMEVISYEMSINKTITVLGIKEFHKLTDNLIELTKPLMPKKHPGPMRRGNRLTRAGLLSRYHSFLLEEIFTIGWHVYGERDYLLQFRPYDSAVETPLKAKSGRHPFFDPAKLTKRAKAVLSRLKINTTTVHPHDRVPSAAVSGGSR